MSLTYDCADCGANAGEPCGPDCLGTRAKEVTYTVRREVIEVIEVDATSVEDAENLAALMSVEHWTRTITSEVALPPHTVGGKRAGGAGYGVTHDMDCPACVASGLDFTLTPRSETYWAS